MSAIVRNEVDPTAKTLSRHSLLAVLETAVRFECGGAVWTEDAQVLDAVVVRDAVGVIEDQGHPTAPPHLSLTTELAPPLLQTSRIQAILQMVSAICRVLHQYLFERGWRGAKCSEPHGVRIEVTCRDMPLLGVLLERSPVTARTAVPKPSESLRP